MLFVCPKCGNQLVTDSTRALCKNNHSFDKSKYGYYNLLLSNVGGIHGDNKLMVMARRNFLSGGYYQPLADKVAELTLKYTNPHAIVLDAGAGEGYYTDIIEKALSMRDGESHVYAFDISKDAVRELTKRNKRINSAVAGSYHMPIADATVDAVINTFSPMAREEVQRVLKPDGVFIMVIPDKEHLFELKAAIYDTPYKNEPADSLLLGFELVFAERIKYLFKLTDCESVKNLFMMTPYAYRTKEENKERVLNLSALDCTADFKVFVYKKTIAD